MNKPAFYEFFAGGGMARAGLGEAWHCLFASDIDTVKSNSYCDNFGNADFHCGDIHNLTLAHLPGIADLAWASFPCQDLSLAGLGKGLEGARSGAFWGFVRLMKQLREHHRHPRLLVLENVAGLLTVSNGSDFRDLCAALIALDYRIGALMIDARYFLPQSRNRLFIIAARNDLTIAPGLVNDVPSPFWISKALIRAHDNLPQAMHEKWVWWHLPSPVASNKALSDIIEDRPVDVVWHTPAQTRHLLEMMSWANSTKLTQAIAQFKNTDTRVIGTIYRRTWRNISGNGRSENHHINSGEKTQRAEVRFDGLAGCLRTASGGSSRQLIITIDREGIRTRLLSAREAARLMGLPDTYRLPVRYNDACRLIGDGLAVPAVRFLAGHLLLGLLGTQGTGY